MLRLCQILIDEELRTDEVEGSRSLAAVRVCAKLQRSLSVLAGVAGFRSVLIRAVALAKVEAPWLSELQISPVGVVILPPGLEEQLGEAEANRGTAMLIRHLTGLLITLIGEGLTLRLLQDVWPKAVLGESGKENKNSS